MSQFLITLVNKLPDNINPASRQGVMLIEDMLRRDAVVDITRVHNLELVFPLTHRFADGVYAREMFIPAGTVIVGKIHKFGHLNVITKGKCVVLTEFGTETLEAPHTFISKPGTKRVVGAIEDTVWTTFHGVGKETDLSKIEDQIICKTFEEFDALALEDKS